MQVEVDQSGKIGDTRVPTVLAFSNDESYAILIPATVKRECVHSLRRRFRRARQPYMKLFAAALFLLIEQHLSTIDTLIIDAEYPGHEGEIRQMLVEHIWRSNPTFPSERITFGQIGKRSPAHQMAYETYTATRRPNRTIRKAELLSVLDK